nr:mechanosensitive ion channel domain-containing protein [Pseudomaricurvus alkylphenolicus]
MESMWQGVVQVMPALVPSLALLTAAVLALHWLGRRSKASVHGQRFRDQLVVAAVILATLVGLPLTLPLENSVRGQLLTVLGLLLTAIVTLSSPTIAANAMAGFMLRSLKNFSPGDFIRVGDHFGRVTEQDLFHTEIQMEDRNLLTLPNLYLATNPVKVVHADGTIVSAEISLGYDVDHQLVEALLLQAATDAELQEPFVHVMALGDFAISYRVSGFLQQVRQILSSRSLLHKKMMDRLHEQGVEIVSPSFMNQRQVSTAMIPERSFMIAGRSSGVDPEELIFDKAERAQQIQELQSNYEELKQEVAALDEEDPQMARKKRRLKAIKRALQMLQSNGEP